VNADLSSSSFSFGLVESREDKNRSR
jgi:hypothetical protein